MIFDVSPSQIQKLDSKELVELLRKLLHAEARKTGISLRGVSVPLQINVSDDGEDARVSWEKGRNQTDYLPCRFCIFQSKATDPKPAGWKEEMWTYATRGKGKTRALNGAIVKAISEGGAYIGFTTATLIGTKKYDGRIEGIREGIKEAGADPDDLAAIDIYDANKIAQWASVHPSVAAWLNERQSGLRLGGFQTIEGWGNNADVASVEYEEDNRRRYLKGEVEKQSLDQDAPPEDLGPALSALWHEAKGDWAKAHRLAQSQKDADGAWVHAYLHRVEGDLSNAGHWYRRAEKPQSTAPVKQEWDEIAETLLGG